MADGISKSSRIVIAGAGIGGLATALALQQRGFQPLLCERAPQLSEIGAGLLLSPNGVRALEFLGLSDQAMARSRVIREWRILDRTGRCLQRMRPHNRDFPALSLHRADLQFLFLEHVSPKLLRLGAEISSVRSDSDELAVNLVSGESIGANALIGADGLKSAVRSCVFGAEPPTYSGYVGWRGVSPWTPPEYAGEHLSESWAEGKRFGISPLGHGRCYWYATANRPAGRLVPTANRRAELLEQFGHWHRPIAALIEATPSDQILENEIHDRVARHPWTKGAITLLGDAAHPMTPNLGQGACFALEDACVIARCIDRSKTFADAFQHYEQLRSRRADKIQRQSRWLGKLIQLESPTGIAVRDAVLTLTPNRFADLSMRELFGFRP